MAIYKRYTGDESVYRALGRDFSYIINTLSLSLMVQADTDLLICRSAPRQRTTGYTVCSRDSTRIQVYSADVVKELSFHIRNTTPQAA